jgi:hypothetical protein
MTRITFEVPTVLLSAAREAASRDAYDSAAVATVALLHYVHATNRKYRLKPVSNHHLMGDTVSFIVARHSNAKNLPTMGHD